MLLPLDRIIKTNLENWMPVDHTGEIEYLDLADDGVVRTRLTRFAAGAMTTAQGAVAHDYVEEIYVISGCIHDLTTGENYVAGDYIHRNVGAVHGPFHAERYSLVIEISHLDK